MYYHYFALASLIVAFVVMAYSTFKLSVLCKAGSPKKGLPGQLGKLWITTVSLPLFALQLAVFTFSPRWLEFLATSRDFKALFSAIVVFIVMSLLNYFVSDYDPRRVGDRDLLRRDNRRISFVINSLYALTLYPSAIYLIMHYG